MIISRIKNIISTTTLVTMPSFAKVAKFSTGITCAATVGVALMPIGFIGLGCISARRAFSTKNGPAFYNKHTSIEQARSVCIMLAAAPVCFGMFAVSMFK